MTSKKHTYKKKQADVQQLQSAIPPRLPAWYHRAMALADRPPPVIIVHVDVRTSLDLPAAARKKINRKMAPSYVHRGARSHASPVDVEALVRLRKR